MVQNSHRPLSLRHPLTSNLQPVYLQGAKGETSPTCRRVGCCQCLRFPHLKLCSKLVLLTSPLQAPPVPGAVLGGWSPRGEVWAAWALAPRSLPRGQSCPEKSGQASVAQSYVLFSLSVS